MFWIIFISFFVGQKRYAFLTRHILSFSQHPQSPLFSISLSNFQIPFFSLRPSVRPSLIPSFLFFYSGTHKSWLRSSVHPLQHFFSVLQVSHSLSESHFSRILADTTYYSVVSRGGRGESEKWIKQKSQKRGELSYLEYSQSLGESRLQPTPIPSPSHTPRSKWTFKLYSFPYHRDFLRENCSEF